MGRSKAAVGGEVASASLPENVLTIDRGRFSPGKWNSDKTMHLSEAEFLEGISGFLGSLLSRAGGFQCADGLLPLEERSSKGALSLPRFSF